MKKLTLKTVIWKEGKYYIAQCLNVDVSSFGNTKVEAVKNIKEALELYFDGKDTRTVKEVASPSLVQTSVYA
jgi:predicted RNase H-like HicB family nuclease